MSKKKEKKIKRLQHAPVWQRVAGIIITRILVIGGTIFMSSVAAIGTINTVFLNNIEDAHKLVQCFNETYGKVDSQEFERQMEMCIRQFDSVEDILLLDSSNRNVIKNFGETDAFFSTATKEMDAVSKRTFEKDGAVSVLDEDLDTSMEFSFGDLEPRLGNFLSMFNSTAIFNDRELADWAGKEALRMNFVSYYKTDDPQVNVCIKELVSLNTFQMTVLMVLGMLIFAVTLGCMIVAVFKVIAAIAEQNRINQLVAMDTVTGGNNKTYFLQRSKTLMRKRSLRSYAVVQLRLNKYHNFCTAYGVKQGENLLEDLDKAISSSLQKKRGVRPYRRSGLCTAHAVSFP